jgi:hypothetical protein
MEMEPELVNVQAINSTMRRRVLLAMGLHSSSLMPRSAFEVFRTYKNSCALRAEQMSGRFYTFYVEICVF